MTEQERKNWQKAAEIWQEYDGNHDIIVAVIARLLGTIDELKTQQTEGN